MCRHFVPTSRGYLNGWRVPTAVLLWTRALKFLMERCTIDRGERKMKSTRLSFRISTTLETPKVPRELEVFLRMSRERLRLCCGIQCTDRLHPNGPRQRQKLYTAALKLLWFAVGIDSVQCENAAQAALHAAIWPLLRLMGTSWLR